MLEEGLLEEGLQPLKGVGLLEEGMQRLEGVLEEGLHFKSLLYTSNQVCVAVEKSASSYVDSFPLPLLRCHPHSPFFDQFSS